MQGTRLGRLLEPHSLEPTRHEQREGRVDRFGQLVPTVSAAAAASGGSRNGWTYWIADLADGRFALSSLREVYLSSRDSSS
jgi:hypothetical protein